jgi:hypothetical protein
MSDRIHLNSRQHLGFHPVQIIQNTLAIGKYKILCQLANAVIKSFVSVFEVQLYIPPVFPQSQQADGSSPSNAL